jgi:hypothetical protein
MRTARRISWLAALTLATWCTAPALAHHLTFSASADRFEIDGNAFGPADGTADQIDEFDDGILAPNWSVLLGTAVESGGLLTLRNPGVDINLVPGAPLDISNVENTTDVEDGEGDFTATSYWTGPPTGANTQIHFQLYGIGATIEAAGLTLANLDANGTGGGLPVGYSISQEVTFLGSSGGVPQQNTVAINAADITGAIVLRMAFDDATNTMLCTFSLDGGATFQSPFPALHVFQVVPSAEILLGANAIDVGGPPPPPPPTTVVQRLVGTKLLVVKSGTTPTARKVTEQITSANDPLAVLPGFGATLNLQVGAVTQCFHLPQNLWRFRSTLAAYSDPRGLYGPVKTVKIHRTGSGAVLVKMSLTGRIDPLDIVPPGGPAVGATNLRLNGVDTALEYCGSTVGGSVVTNTVKSFKVKAAPPPAACPLAACSPSGAFLEDPATGF